MAGSNPFENFEQSRDEKEEASPLHAEYVMVASTPAQSVEKGQDQGKDKGDGKTEQEVEPPHEKKKLATGDTFVTSESGDVLLMPDGSKLAFSLLGEVGDFGTLAELPERLAIRNKDGEPVSVRYSATQTSIPPIDIFNLSDGSQIKVQSGIAILTMNDGATIYMDELGVFGVQRGEKRDLIRQPEIIGNQLEDMVVPGNPKREM